MTKQDSVGLHYTDRRLLADLHFLRATAVPVGTAEARISYGDSVRLSVRLSRPGAETTE